MGTRWFPWKPRISPENRWKQLRNHDEPLYFWGQNPRNFRQTPFGSLVTSMCFFIFAIPEKLWPFHGSQCLKHLDALRFAVTKTAFTYKNYAGLPKWRGLHQQRKGGLNHGLPIFHGGKWWFNHVENHQTIWGCLVVVSHKSLWGCTIL